MAKPRVFISSTFYDLKHIRNDLDQFIKDIGYEPIRNESGEIPFGVNDNLEEYCYREVYDVDILVGIIGNRYGNGSSHSYYSITQQEIKTAVKQGKQVYIFIDKNVYSEYGTYTLNKSNATTTYKYVDDTKIYEFIDEIYPLKAGVIIQPFENTIDIISFLKIQWAGLFREALRQNSNTKQFDLLSQKVNELASLTEVLKEYFEKALPNIMKDAPSAELVIKEENKKLREHIENLRFENIEYIRHLNINHRVSLSDIKQALIDSNDLYSFITSLKQYQKRLNGFQCAARNSRIEEINNARVLIGKDPYLETVHDLRVWLNHNPEIAFSAAEYKRRLERSIGDEFDS